MEFLSTIAVALVVVAPFIALFVTGRLVQPRAERLPLTDLSSREIWSAVRRGNDLLAPTTPYEEYARS